MLESMIDYAAQHWTQYTLMIVQHLKISIIVIAIAAGIGIPFGYLSSRSRRLYGVLSSLFSILKVIPSLAILVLCIPIIGVGEQPAMIALSLLAIPSVLINTAMGFANVPSAVLETANGMGMGPLRILFRIQLPLAFPMILTGIRICAVETISCATLASYIGAGGLGNLILIGFGNRFEVLLLGGLSVAFLAIMTDIILLLWERKITSYKRL